ncbi:unnamed protein product [Adineta ricciae]|uniref:Uncharacterized protein n=1 Tax=Adineta ricciae TaxID=249248 RepID=A0A814W2I5_ADIRI|nr:unnamed protein product [Adineta ricciae]
MLDAQVDSTEENKQTQQQLLQMINHLKIFHDQQQCHDYVTSFSSQDRLVLIMKSVVTRTKNLIDQINADQKGRTKTEEPLSITIFNATCIADQPTIGLNGHFAHSHLLIDVLLQIESTNKDKNRLITLYKQHFHNNNKYLATVDEFEREHSSNKVLRMQNIDVLFLLRFVINDIYQQLKQHQCQSAVRVHRGQVMSTDELEILRRSIGELISIN